MISFRWEYVGKKEKRKVRARIFRQAFLKQIQWNKLKVDFYIYQIDVYQRCSAAKYKSKKRFVRRRILMRDIFI